MRSELRGSWAHMVRSVGGRLSELDILGQLPLTAVTSVARNAAVCGEPQFRLAASLGFRIEKQTRELATEDMIDLIGAAGKLGGLHGGTLAKHFEEVFDI